ncbi:transcription elongation factor B polypeptide 3 [Chlorella sorokiniana]|uniref:Transcription elongation factor B polypeptide 3 n=1 Tax=Chlorella sorokiniana TaxID=3076 RepID=A0A2P6THQ4_CHLSO|nr:transcription elongation factor B polypeptide 3 [Chlorella sorokiniana]|eukprot:PRW33814.1 transcription elongation factor B polypeptide 3 [Chlorella sorokiniana]
MVVPTLQRLAVATLIRFRDALGDIGYAPVELLQDVLAACSPQQLATIEDETLAGTGRTLKPWTWDLWREHWQRQFAGSFGAPASGTPPPLPPAAEVAEGEPGVQPADYRALYERCQAELEQKRAESGARLRALREQAEQERQARHTQVVDAGTMPGRRRRQQQRPGPASSGGRGGSASHRAQPAQQLSYKRAAERSSGGSKGGGGRGTQPPAKKPRPQQQAEGQLVEVDLFDGL